MKKYTDTPQVIGADYRQFVEELKERVAAARLSAARRINHEMIFLHWDIGRGIVEKQKALGWGESVVEMVAADLRKAFPSMTGFSPRNVWYMRRLYEAYSAPEFLSQAVREMVVAVPWGHHVNSLAALDDPAQRLYYLVRRRASGGVARCC